MWIGALARLVIDRSSARPGTAVRLSDPVIRPSIRLRCLVIPLPASPAHLVILVSPAPNFRPRIRVVAASDRSNRPVTGRDPPTPAHRRRPRLIAAPALPCRRVSPAIAQNRRRPGTALDRTCPLDSAQDPDRVRPNHPPAIAPRIRGVRRRANGQGRSRTHVNSHPVRRIARVSSPSSNVPAACRLSAPA